MTSFSDQLLNTVGGSDQDSVSSDCAFLEPEEVKTTSVIDGRALLNHI